MHGKDLQRRGKEGRDGIVPSGVGREPTRQCHHNGSRHCESRRCEAMNQRRKRIGADEAVRIALKDQLPAPEKMCRSLAPAEVGAREGCVGSAISKDTDGINLVCLHSSSRSSCTFYLLRYVTSLYTNK